MGRPRRWCCGDRCIGRRITILTTMPFLRVPSPLINRRHSGALSLEVLARTSISFALALAIVAISFALALTFVVCTSKEPNPAQVELKRNNSNVPAVCPRIVAKGFKSARRAALLRKCLQTQGHSNSLAFQCPEIDTVPWKTCATNVICERARSHAACLCVLRTPLTERHKKQKTMHGAAGTRPRRIKHIQIPPEAAGTLPETN